MSTTAIIIIIGIVALIIGALLGMIFSKSSLNSKANFILQDASKSAENLLEKAKIEAESIKKEKQLQAKEKFLELKSNHDADVQARERKMADAEKRSKDKEQKLNDELSRTKKLEANLAKQVEEYNKKAEILERKSTELDAITAQKVEVLEKVANFTAEEAKTELIDAMKAEAKSKAQAHVQIIMEEAQLNAELLP